MRTHNLPALILLLASLSAQLVLPQESRRVISQTVPDFPPVAKRLHLIGKVKLVVVIAPSGTVASATLLGGSPVFEQSAVKAMKQWKFERADKETKEIIFIEFTH